MEELEFHLGFPVAITTPDSVPPTPLVLAHEHDFVPIFEINGIRILDCACGQRRRWSKSLAGDMVEDFVKPGGSVANAFNCLGVQLSGSGLIDLTEKGA